MPIYEYQCLECGKIEEAIQKISDPALTACPSCSGKLQKLVSQSSFHLKGTGWYVTDYKKRGGPEKQSDTGNSDAKTGKQAAGSSASPTASKEASTQ